MAVGFGVACPKPTKMQRLMSKADRRKADEKALDKWRQEIWTRDKGKDRYTGKKVVRTLELQPNRGECHHIIGRVDRAVRYVVKNGLLLSYETHLRFEAGELVIVKGQSYRHPKENKPCWDADWPLEVLDVDTGITRWI